jgi:hypothetical protein
VTYRHRQKATLINLVISAFVVALIVAVVVSHMKAAAVAIILVTIAIIVGTMYLFSSLEVSVDDGVLKISFGPGFVHKSFPLADVVSMRPVMTAITSGWGIHNFRGGVLYNVSGRQAVELTMRNGRQVRVGTDEPQALLAALRAATGLPEES